MSSNPRIAFYATRKGDVVVYPADPAAAEALANAMAALNLDGRSTIQTPGIDHKPGAMRPGSVATLPAFAAGEVAARLSKDGWPTRWALEEDAKVQPAAPEGPKPAPKRARRRAQPTNNGEG